MRCLSLAIGPVVVAAILFGTVGSALADPRNPPRPSSDLCKTYRFQFDQAARGMEPSRQLERATILRARGYHFCRTGRRGMGQYMLQGALLGIGVRPDPDTLITYATNQGLRKLRRVYPELKGRVSERRIPTR